ncbi:BglG family transcription antiterminator [Mycoplasmatota bacterium]|nr:BglG family transcription antiterminator [Mycoplasmatota bacterium]
MKTRENDIIYFILEKEVVSFEVLLNQLNVSKRTLYYDIASINKKLDGICTIIKVNKKLRIVGDISKLKFVLREDDNNNYEKYLDYNFRKEFILDELLKNKNMSLDSLCKNMLVSKSTIVQTINRLKEELLTDDINLTYEKGYHLTGDEIKIRDLYLTINMSPDINKSVNDGTYLFDSLFNLKLTDNSKCLLSEFIAFLQSRYDQQHILSSYSIYSDAIELSYYNEVDMLFDEEISEFEKAYVSAYISSLPSLNSTIEENRINLLVDKLIDQLEQKLSIVIENKTECRESIARHLYSSFNRIKYRFPVFNPLLKEIRMKYKSIYIITEMIFRKNSLFPEFEKIRDEEIAFVVSYLGAYIYKENIEDNKSLKTVIVCPNGLTVSKTIEYQVQRYFPSIEIVASIPISQIDNLDREFDFIISTIKLEGYENVIVVNPLLRKYDFDQIKKRISTQDYCSRHTDIEEVIKTVRKYANITNEKGLRQELYNSIYEIDNRGGYPMLKELLTKNRIQILDEITNWQKAIEVAAHPLLNEGVIEERYIEAMVESVIKYGPYIVLTDKFALAHSRPESGVNKLSMSLLKLNKPVDLLGKEVNLIVVLAATDNKSHLEALASLSELMMEKENIESIINSDTKDKILELINIYS